MDKKLTPTEEWRREILVPYGERSKIAKSCKCSVMSVRFALKGCTDTELSRLIRVNARKYYGGVYAKK